MNDHIKAYELTKVDIGTEMCDAYIELNSKGCVGVVGFKKVYNVQNRSCVIQK